MGYTKPVALVATLALALAGLASPAAAAPLRITFAGESGPGNLDLFTITPAGQGRQKITSGSAKDTLPAWSPARDVIVFTRDAPNGSRRLFAVGPSGSGVHAIPHTVDGGAPSWAPDGGLIAFDTSHGDGPSRIYTVTPSGGSLTPLTNGPADSYPDWSPDSKRIVFQRKGELWRMKADGTQLKRLTDHGKQPAWRPNGKHIAFVRKVNGKPAVFAMGPDGSHVQQLVQKGERPAWEPNSRHLAYGAPAAGGFEIRTILFGGANAPVPEHVTAGQTPAW
jgi:Tol biopolymer transport system component